jgi:hypothetical protein
MFITTGCDRSEENSKDINNGLAKPEITEVNNSNDDFIKTGQYSFGLDVCNEYTSESVSEVMGMPIVNTRDYSNSKSTGCEYYINEKNFVIVDVGYSKFEDRRKGLKVIEREITSDSSIGLENFIAISSNAPGEYLDVYMLIDPEIKFIRVGRSSTQIASNDLLVELAKSVEQVVRSYK